MTNSPQGIFFLYFSLMCWMFALLSSGVADMNSYVQEYSCILHRKDESRRLVVLCLESSVTSALSRVLSDKMHSKKHPNPRHRRRCGWLETVKVSPWEHSFSFFGCCHPKQEALLSNLLTFQETLLMIPSRFAFSSAASSICLNIICQSVTVIACYHDNTNQGMSWVLIYC